ncbi:UDP-glucose 4-epimerase [Austwickia chelonae]|uniref:UDP-glucose 4-epimerase n=1 Tax=Austwickia chelonae NBRC 105200 TaxID=1184607 RepID=K6UNJ5_9MICO|nr:UDP-glucose 4-epimerase GalE [Austwickia chelonae]GAB79021.1 UDP-glucose 4-epimerase [Austwickia chelonae NBRC 105200]SEW41684.1 UDP-glucose 4-epimerase [Austwickia chelonae]
MRVVVTGGCGYIGSHTVLHLVEAGHHVVVVDDFSNSSPLVIDRLEELARCPLTVHRFSVEDRERTMDLFAAEPVDAVIHFAGFKAVGESTEQPIDYYRNNIGSTLSLVAAMSAHDVHRLVFSSSATVYGEGSRPPMVEDMPTGATNPYGWTKVMIEQILKDVAATDERWRVALLRYFNPVGAHPSGRIGEDPSGTPNNLLPFIAQVAVGRREKLRVFGGDYLTPDGTGVRDYIHVDDLAAGHVAALAALDRMEDRVGVWNLGTGRGTSVLELLHAFERACGREIPYELVDRRAGDLAETYADPSRAHHDLGWQATRTIDDICASSWHWQSNNPQGYQD